MEKWSFVVVVLLLSYLMHKARRNNVGDSGETKLTF